MSLSPGTRLGAYEILAPLGAGGMGEVYRARDSKLDRDVAIKVLPESVAANPDMLARFEREAKAVATLSHPNILSIFDFGTDHGVSYAVMELLSGQTLRDRLDRGPIPQPQMIDFAIQIAKGLSAAHEKGIVHRDVKPENLFVSKDGHVKILDFGLAKRTEVDERVATSAPTQSEGTAPGTVMGTLGYMSPEQLKGKPVDFRSDIFSFGAVLYEMLSGQKAFKRDTAAETSAAILREEPPDFSASGRIVSPSLDHVVRHCLEKDPDRRFRSAHDIVFALSEASSPASTVTIGPTRTAAAGSGRWRVIAGAAILMGALVAGIVVLRRPHGAAGGVKRLAVLPFENLGSAADDYFADGITDEVRSKLTKVAALAVIARTSSNGYRKTTKKPQEVGKELDAEYLLTGTVRIMQDASGNRRVQVSPELVVASNAESKWAEPFDATVTDVFRVQGEIATNVAEALDTALSAGAKQSLEEKPTQNLAAYEAYLHGEQISQAMSLSDPPSLRRSITEYEKAVAFDPGFVAAWARIGAASVLLYANSVPAPELARRAREACEKALALAPDRPEGHYAMSSYDALILNEPALAVTEAERARALAPGEARYMTVAGVVEQAAGRWEEALAHLEDARRLDPRSAGNLERLGIAALSLRRTAQARDAFEAALALAPTNLMTIESAAMTHLQEGDLAGARAVVRAAPKEIDPSALVAYLANYEDLVWVLDDAQREILLHLTPAAFDDDRGALAGCLMQAYALGHDEANVRRNAEIARSVDVEQLAAAPNDPQRHAFLGLSLAYLGRKDEAIREAKKAVELLPVSKNGIFGPYMQHQLVRVYILTGENEKAIDALEELLRVPYFVTKGWLKIDPNFDPLRKEPRFIKLLG